MFEFDIKKVSGKYYVQFVKEYILKCDRIVIPFYYTDELIPWGDGYHVISKNELGDLPWNFGAEEYGMRYAAMKMEYRKIKDIFMRFTSINSVLNYFQLDGLIFYADGKVLAEITIEGGGFLAETPKCYQK